MTDPYIVLTLNLGLWIFFAWRFVHALQKRRLVGFESMHAWLMFFAAYLVATLTYDPLWAAVDRLFLDQPAAALLRTLLMLLTTQLYFVGLKRLNLPPTRIERVFSFVNPLMITLCVGVFVWNSLTHTLSARTVREILYLLRDVPLSFCNVKGCPFGCVHTSKRIFS